MAVGGTGIADEAATATDALPLAAAADDPPALSTAAALAAKPSRIDFSAACTRETRGFPLSLMHVQTGAI